MINPSQVGVLQHRAAPIRALPATAQPRHLLLWFRLAFLLADAAAAPVAAYAAGHTIGDALPSPTAPASALIASGLLIVTMFFMGGYEIERLRSVGAHLERLAVVLVPIGVLIVSLGTPAAARLGTTTSWLYAWLILGSLLAISARGGLAFLWGRVSCAERFKRRVALVGAGPTAAAMLATFAASSDQRLTGCAIRPLGVFDDQVPAAGGTPGGEMAQLRRLVADGLVDDVIITMPWQEETRIVSMVDGLRALPVELWLAATSLRHGVAAGSEAPHWIGGVRCLRLARPIEGWAGVVKDVMDRLVAAGAVLFLAPLLLVIALAVRLDSKGPVFYRQKRHGIYGRMIEVLKFRTMHVERCDDGSSCLTKQATRGDPRITRVGRILRRASLDELPQLLNVLRGEMSLVGPRPHAVSHDEHYARLIDHYAARQSVKPGITGWAQVNGMRGETETVEKMAKRVQYDLDYIGNWSLGLDLTILLRTIFVGFVHPEAR